MDPQYGALRRPTESCSSTSAHPPQEKQFGSIDDHPVRMAMTDDSHPLSDSEPDEAQRAIIVSVLRDCLPNEVDFIMLSVNAI